MQRPEDRTVNRVDLSEKKKKYCNDPVQKEREKKHNEPESQVIMSIKSKQCEGVVKKKKKKGPLKFVIG